VRKLLFYLIAVSLWIIVTAVPMSPDQTLTLYHPSCRLVPGITKPS